MRETSTGRLLVYGLGIGLTLFTLVEVNYPRLSPPAELALFALLGTVLCVLIKPLGGPGGRARLATATDLSLILLAVLCFLYVVVQTQPLFSGWWVEGRSLGSRAGREISLDLFVGAAGLLVVLESTRRSLGWILPCLSLLFLLYAYSGPYLPDWLLPHRGYSLNRIVSQTFLHSQGVFGVALRVMFTYVFLFVLVGAFLKATGATQFIVDFARQLFRGSAGGPAKVAVLSSGLMGSLSGSAVANTATTGTFTIPMMRASGFRSHTAAGVEAAASSGGALVPPVMGAGAYMMLEIVSPPVSFLEIIRAALLPALLYYLSLFLIVHFYTRRVSAREGLSGPGEEETPKKPPFHEGLIFVSAIGTLLAFLIWGFTPFRAVSLSLLAVLLLSWLHPRTRLGPARLARAMVGAARDVAPLICASACVGIIIGVVTLTGVGSRLPSVILPLAEGNLALALVVIMASTIVLGMGLPSAVCYLLMATLIGPVLGELGVVPLAAHLFIFYFGMMSMVTPPVALAAYAAASIAGTPIMRTAVAAFRFALVGFTLPYMFVFRPELLMLNQEGNLAGVGEILPHLLIAALGIVSFAAGVGRYLFAPVAGASRVLLFVAAALLLYPGRLLLVSGLPLAIHDLAGLALLAFVAIANGRSARRPPRRHRRDSGRGRRFP
jgi:TRAP transporter 4TM/12TM fusion protein